MKIETGIIKSEDGKDPNIHGKVITAAVTLGAIGLLAVGKWAINKNPNATYNNAIEKTDDNGISFTETKDLRLIYIANTTNNNITPYIIRKEHDFFDNKDEYIDIDSEVPLFIADASGQIVNNTILSYEDKGSLDEYLIANNLVKKQYKKEEVKTIINIEKENIEKQRKKGQLTK